MENVVDALYMGVAVLLLLIALSVSISSFTNLKTQMEALMTADDTVDLAYSTDSNGNIEYLNYISLSADVRIVGADTVISSIRRVLAESYTVYLFLDAGGLANEINDECGINIEELTDIKQDYLKNDNSTKEDIINGKTGIKISLQDKIGQGLNNDIIKVIYNNIKDKKFKEYQGIYQNNNNVSSANKKTYRIITYVQEPSEDSTE